MELGDLDSGHYIGMVFITVLMFVWLAFDLREDDDDE
jgi:hypothetical protein|tara:strand:+ start:1329 stop:1439 length:111 start_codon:yes stop_codon:yes gene_type:complete